MKILAIDTSLETCSVGIDLAGETHFRSETIGRGHGERLFGLIEAALGDAAMAIRDFDRLAVTIGPGSFTGLRIGVAAIRGFALVTGAATLGVTTLAVHAEAGRTNGGERPILAVLPARNGNVCGQFFNAHGDALTDPAIDTAEGFAALATKRGAALAGAGSAAIAAAMERAEILHRDSSPGIEAMIRVVRRARPPFESPRPLYLRPPDATPAPAAIVRA